MMKTAERFMIEEFDSRYENRCKLKIALKEFPEFGTLKPVANFTDEEKIQYVKIMRFLEQYVAYVRSVKMGLVERFEDESLMVPSFISQSVVDRLWQVA